MPNPKTGTVTFDVTKAVKKSKLVKLNTVLIKLVIFMFQSVKYLSMKAKLVENFKTIFETLQKAKPAAAKGTYMKNVAITSTMGPGVKVDPSSVGK